jgi:peptidoglycan hydrolase-like protein with peptidoglycan-binding domain
MTCTLKTLACVAASAAMVLGTSTSIAAKRPNRAARSVGPAELQLQVLLDRAGFSPGEIDGGAGPNSRNALAAFQAARGLTSGARSRKALLDALGAGTVEPIVSYTITEEDVAGPFIETIPEDMTEKSKLPGLYYTSVLEALGEKFHSAPALLKHLNPRTRFIAG